MGETHPFGELSDKDLVIAFQSGEPVAYDEIYKRHRPRVAGICTRMLVDPQDAEEAAQEAFLKAYQALGRFNGTYQLGAWLARIAANVCLDHLRARARSGVVVSLPFGDELVDGGGPPPEEVVVGRNPRVSEAIEQIQPLHARALKLRVLGGFSHKEMAGRLAMSPEQVKALLHRARSSFKKAWDKAEGWAFAPVLALRSLGRSQTSDTGPQLVPVGQSFSPLLAERVAASAVMLAVALSGAPSAPDGAGTESRPGREKPRAVAERPGRHDRIEGSGAGTSTATPTARESKPTLLAGVPAIPDDVRETADPDPPKPPRDDDDDDLLPGPGGSQAKPVVKKAREAVEKVLGPR